MIPPAEKVNRPILASEQILRMPKTEIRDASFLQDERIIAAFRFLEPFFEKTAFIVQKISLTVIQNIALTAQPAFAILLIIFLSVGSTCSLVFFM